MFKRSTSLCIRHNEAGGTIKVAFPETFGGKAAHSPVVGCSLETPGS